MAAFRSTWRSSSLPRAALRRMGALAFTLWGATLVTFFISHIVPTDVARLVAGDGASEETVAKIRNDLGLDEPIWTQYAYYMGDLVRGDLGVSIRTQEPVAAELARVIPATAELALAAFILVLIVGVGFGAAAARNKDSVVDQAARIFGAIGVSTPTFWTGLILISVFAGMAGLAPTGGRLDPEIVDAPRITGLLVLDGFLTLRFGVVRDALAHLALPAITLALAPAAAMTRMVRASLLEVYSADYIRRARSAGLDEGVVFRRYALPNALIPLLTVLGVLLADLLVGAVITEIIFGWPGLGAYTIEAIAGLDFPAIMGFTLFAAAVYAVANLGVDILNGLVDPRTRPVR